MKKLTAYLFALMLVAAFTFTGCKKDDDDDPVFDAQKALTDYLVSQDMDINKIIGGFVMMPPADGDLSNRYLIDVRSADDFAAGHIEGAVNVAFGNVLTEAAKANKPILIICYSGNNATYLVGLLRLAGYMDAQALKWGMSVWHTDFANHASGWNNQTKNIAEGHANWTTAPAPTNLTYESPKFSATSTDPAEILRARVTAVLADGFKRVTPAEALNGPQNYFINNFFPENHYTGFGHINGAVRIQPMLLGEGHVNFNDPSKMVVTYCYTGQTSGAITAFLRVIGYDAYSMVFGMNTLYHSNTTWAENRWGEAPNVSKDLPYVSSK